MAMLKLTKQYDRYPKYKDSGVEWIGEIPKGWGVVPMRSLFSTKKQLVGEDASSHKLLGLTLGGVKPRPENDKGKHPEKYDTYQEFKTDDLVFCLFDYDVTPRTIGYVQEDGMLTGAYTRLIPKQDVVSRYYYYHFLALDQTKELLHLCTGLRSSLSKPVFWSMANQKPAYDEQEKIVAYLGEKTALIDAILEKKKKQIELLREKRAAIINRAVTKGLPARRSLGEGGDPNAKLIDSGIEWIGKIPEGWEVKKLKYVAQVEGGYAFSSDSYTSDSVTGVLLVRITEVKEQIAEECRRYVPSDLWDTLKTFRVQQGDILITLTGYVGETSMFPLQEKALLNQRAGKIQSSPNIHPKFLYYCTKPDAFRTFLSLRSKSSAQENVSNSDIGEFVLPFPPKREQQEIAEHIEEQCEKYLRAQDMLERSVALLQEFKSALISHVVTGKVKV